jgi:hypothetical protein
MQFVVVEVDEAVLRGEVDESKNCLATAPGALPGVAAEAI